MWEQIQPAVIDFISGIGLALLGLMAAQSIAYINRAATKIKTETAQIKDRQQREMILHATSRLQEVAEKTVLKIEQTTASELRQAVKDGKIERQELLDLSEKAYKEIIQTVEPQVIDVLQESIGNVKLYLMNVIEAEVKNLKFLEAISQK